VSFAFSADSRIGEPMIFARLSSQMTNGTFIAYYARVLNPSTLELGRHDGANATVLATKAIAPSLALKTVYRLKLSVSGTNPVMSATELALLDGTIVSQVANNDGTAARLVNAGSVGFGGTNALGSRTRFDDYARTSP